MNRGRLIAGLVVAVAVATLLSTYVYRVFERASNLQPVAMGQMVVAAEPLPLGTRLTTANIKVIPWPENDPVPGMLTRVEDGLDRAVIAQVAPNEPILESKLAPKTAGAGLGAAIPAGMRAVSVAVNEVVGVAGFVVPGSAVDVLVTGQTPGATQQSITRTVLENVRVLAAGQKVEQDREGKPQTVAVVTLLVSPEQAVKLTMASTEGKIQLALRNTIDAELKAPEPVLQSVLFGGAAPPPVTHSSRVVAQAQKPEAPPPPYTVEVIIGGKRETRTFPSTPNPPSQQNQ